MPVEQPDVTYEDILVHLRQVRPTKHYGPGDHPGTGTPQAVHGHGVGAHASEATDRTTPEAGNPIDVKTAAIRALNKRSEAWIREHVAADKPWSRRLLKEYVTWLNQQDEVGPLKQMLRDTADDKHPAIEIGHDEFSTIPRDQKPVTYILGWAEGGETPIHDHAGSEVAVIVTDGVLSEDFFVTEGRRVNLLNEAGTQTSSLRVTRELYAPSAISLPTPYIHKMYNADPDYTISIHSYYPPLLKMGYYDFKPSAAIEGGNRATGTLSSTGQWQEDTVPMKGVVSGTLTFKTLKHFGPGDHPGTGTSQDVHGHGGGGGESSPKGDGSHATNEADLFRPYNRELDQWSKDTIKRLDAEAATGIEKMAAIEAKLREGAATVTAKATDWDSLPDVYKEKAEEYYIDQYMDSEMESQKESHVEYLDQTVRDDQEWATERFKEWLKPEKNEETGEDYDVPDIDPKSIEDAMGANGKIDPSKLVWLRDNPDQLELELDDPKVLSARWDEWKAAWKDWYEHEVQQEVERRSEDEPEWMQDAAKESLAEAWDSLDDEDKYNYALKYTDYEEGGESEGVEFPDAWTFEDLMAGTPSHKGAAQALVNARYEELMGERKGDLKRFPADDFSDDLWSGWKNSSTSNEGYYIQVATARELGGRLQETDGLRYFMEHNMREDKLAAAQAHIRATWETNQYLLSKANVKELQVYRGIDLPERLIRSTRQETVEVDGREYKYTKLPNITLKMNGAQSTAAKWTVANTWKGVDRPAMENPQRVVIRMRTPTGAIVGLPVYGKNVHSEHEVVVAGVPLHGWDAWVDESPKVEDYYIKWVVGGPRVPTKHYGPGDHPGTGTAQEVHGGGTAVADDPIESMHQITLDRLRRRFHDAIDQASLRDQDQRKIYRDAVNKALAFLSEHQAQSLALAVEDIHFYRAVTSVSAAAAKLTGQRGGEIDTILAFWHPATRSLHLNSAGSNPDGTVWEVYTHEFFHAIDFVGPGGTSQSRYSDEAEWKLIWATELGDGQLTEYAGTNHREGFAEFGRLVVIAPKLAEKKLPRSFAFFKKHRLT